MIKKYLQFIKESFEKSRLDFNSLGEWIEYLYELYSTDDEKLYNLKRIVNRNFNVKGKESLEEIGSDIRLANAINILDERIQKEIKYYIDQYLENGIEEKEPVIDASTNVEELMESEITMSGKGVFTSFLKTLTALGQKEKIADFDNCPDDFILFYYYPNMESAVVKSIFERFRSLSTYSDLIDYGKNDVTIYFGIKNNAELEYGIMYEDRITFGSFRLSTSVIKWLNNLESKAAFSLKKELVNLNYNDILTLGQIKNDMMTYNPGYFESKMKPTLSDRVITFGLKGIGKWDNGRIDQGEFMNIKNNFVNWLMSKKWSSKVLISVAPGSYWIYFHLKLK
jgi:hypothetical protein